MSEERIRVTGISVADGPLGPSGNHLRWSFPPAAGFPPKGFRIFRRETKKPSDESISFASLPLDVPLPEDLRIGGVDFITHPAGARLRCRVFNQERRLVISPASSAQLELRFDVSPLVHARLVMSGTGFGSLRAYRNRKLLEETTSGGEVREVFTAGSNRLRMNLGSGQLRTISFTTEASACSARDWVLVKELPLPQQDSLKRLEGGLKNYYAASAEAARLRYQKAAPEIVKWMQHLLSPTDDVFVDSSKPPNLLKLRSDTDDATTAAYLQSVFLLAALDPNIARLMSLYWVDAFDSTEPRLAGPPKKDLLYDYKVVGQWNDGDDRCGVLLNLGPPAAPQPSLAPELTGHQLTHLRWLNGEWRGRVGLKWPRPSLATTAQGRAVQPVLYELTRTFQNKDEQIKEPILVEDRAWDEPEAVLYVDRDLKLGTYTYKVRPIDIFGQIGPPLSSAPVTVADNQAPPPPIRTRSLLTQNGPNAQVRLQFEFGAAQHQQAPDINVFEVYWRPDTLFTRTLVNVSVLSTKESADGFIHTIRLRRSNLAVFPPEQFTTLVGDVLTNVITNATNTLPANERRRFRIASIVAPDRAVLEPAPAEMPSQNYELVHDPHKRRGWTKLPQQTINWREPVTGVLSAVRTNLPVEVLRVHHPELRADPFSSVPPDKRPRQFPNVPPAEEVIEVEINRVLTEPDAFADGEAAKAGWPNRVKLIYVVTSLAEGLTRVAFPANTAIAVGDRLDLFPAPDLSETLRLLTIEGSVDRARQETPGGEIAFESGSGSNVTTVIMRVISSAVNASGVYDLVVRAENSASILSLRPNQTRIRYYAPFVTSFPVSFSQGSGAPIVLQTPATAGYRDAFIAVNAVDKRNNEGPLSASSQLSLVLPGPSGVPSKPYPCGMDVLATAGYASPPNRAGRATTCLTWDTDDLSPFEGLRFEVARAMDNTILTTHLRNWQMGKVQLPATVPITAGPTTSGTVVSVNTSDPNGLIEVLFIPSAPVVDPDKFRKGRLVKNDRYFEVTVLKPSGSALQVLLRGQLPPESVLGTVTIEGPPQYAQGSEDVASLQALADQVPDAFALVTGVPIDTNRFTDDVAGTGRNRFFYRVRAVDAAENRSGWSPISAPFYQVDTTPPEPPKFVQVLGGDRRVVLKWHCDSDPAIRYRLFRSVSRDALETIEGHSPIAEITPDRSRLELEYIDEPLEGTVADDRYYYRLTALKHVRRGAGENGLIEVSTHSSAIASAQVLDTASPDPPDWIAAQWWDTAADDVATLETTNISIRLEWEAIVPGARFTVERSHTGGMLWQEVASGPPFESAGVPSAQNHLLMIDRGVDPTLSYSYRIKVRNKFGRENIGLVISLEPLS